MMDNPQHPRSLSVSEDPWINVRYLDGTTGTVSIRDAFARADEIREITGELPTQSFAILRLLLAILYRAHQDPITLEAWTPWYRTGLPLADVDDYLAEYRDRFHLFGTERPFFQVRDLATAKGERKDVAPLIADLPANNRLFTNRAGTGATSLEFAEAARWLIHAQAFDLSGIKSGALGDSRVKGGRGYPIGTGWAGLLGGVYVQGRNLRETLLLNLAPQTSQDDADYEADIPPWEDPEPDTAAERSGLVPRGPVRLFTWQSRRIRLFPEGGRVIGCLVANGDKLTPQNMQRFEPLTAWRFSEPQTKALKHTTYMPREHQPGRALWRGIGALLPGIAPVVPKRDVPSGLAPRVIEWLEKAANEEVLDRSIPVRVRAVGLIYGSQSSVVSDVINDQVLLPLALLRTTNRILAQKADEAVVLANDGVRAIRHLAENLERAAGGTGEARPAGAAETAWSELDRPYRMWLSSLSDDSNPLDALDRWKSTAHSILRGLGDELVTQAGPTAWVGRDVSRLGQSELITASRAHGWFRRALLKTFGPLGRTDEAA